MLPGSRLRNPSGVEDWNVNSESSGSRVLEILCLALILPFTSSLINRSSFHCSVCNLSRKAHEGFDPQPGKSSSLGLQYFRKLRDGEGCNQSHHIGGRSQHPVQKRPLVHGDPSLLWMWQWCQTNWCSDTISVLSGPWKAKGSMVETHTERYRDIGRGRSRLPAQSLMVGLIPGLQDQALSQRQTLNHWMTQESLTPRY